MKVTVGGETFDFDPASRPMSEALAIEREWKRRYAEWESELAAGSAEAMAVFVWLVLRRDGRDVPLADILDGKFDFDYGELQRSLVAGADGEQAADPTSGAAISTAPDGSDSTPSATGPSSPRSSTSARGKSGGSAQPSSTA